MKKPPISVRIIHVLSVIVFWIMMAVAVAVFVFNILIQTGVIGDEFELRVALPVSFQVEETGTVPIYGELNDVRIEEATGQLHIVDTPLAFSKIVLRILFVVTMLGLFMTWKFMLFITNIKNGQVFEMSNINNLKHIAYALLILWFTTKVYMEIFYQAMVKFINFNSIQFSNDVVDNNGMLIGALLLWVLAHVFMKGQELQEEYDQTI